MYFLKKNVPAKEAFLPEIVVSVHKVPFLKRIVLIVQYHYTGKADLN